MIGRTISQYHVIAELGAGAMGAVYKAEDIRLHRFVALKFLSEEIAQDRLTLTRFQHEAEAASPLNHPTICTIGAGDGSAFIVRRPNPKSLICADTLRLSIKRADPSKKYIPHQRIHDLPGEP
jgi:serine/threonine protein kinase